jgi:hypothetical protein
MRKSELHRLKLLTILDISSLAAYCAAYARWRTAAEAVGQDGDGPNVVSSDVSNPNFRTPRLPGRRRPSIVYFEAPANDGSARPLLDSGRC